MKKTIVASFIAGVLGWQGNLLAAEEVSTPSPEATDALVLHALTIDAAQAASHTGRYARATTTYYNNADKAKIDVLYGKWQLTYKDTALHTDTLELDTTVNDSKFGYYGWDGKHALSCYYEPGIVKTSYSYECIHLLDANAGTAQRYLFNMNGNTLSGKYFNGTIDGFFDAIQNNQLIDLVGNNGNVSAAAEPAYDDNTKILSIPKVTAFGKTYNAILINEGNGLFRLKSANPL